LEAAATPPVQRTVKYARDVQTEMRKVVWPTRQQLVAYTLALLGSVIVGALCVVGLLARAFSIGRRRGERQPLLEPVGARPTSRRPGAGEGVR